MKDRQAEVEERLVEKKTPNVILHSLHGVQGRETKARGEEKRGRNGGRERGEKEEEEEEGDKRESLTWRQTEFQYPTVNHTDTRAKYRHYASGTEVLLVTSHRPKLD